MKLRFLAAWAALAAALPLLRVEAQDLTVTDPAWLDAENATADVLPKFKKSPSVSCPDELKKVEVFAYGIMLQTVDPKGARRVQSTQVTNPYMEAPLGTAGSSMVAATRGGKPVTTASWYAVIFNPKSASAKRDDADPRVLAVAPIAVEKPDVPEGTKLPKVVYATLAIDKSGALESFSFENPADEVFREQVGGSLRNWRFAPARKDGINVAGGLRAALVVAAPLKAKISVPMQPPKVLYREMPRYPRAMHGSRLNGQVLVEFVVDEKGKVIAPVVKRSTNPGFNEAAIEAISAWKFAPASSEGVPVKTRMQQPLDFSISGGRDYATVKNTSRKSQEKVPEKWRFDVPPKPDGVIVPVYPYALLKEKSYGKVLVVLLISADGKVRESKVVETSRSEFGYAMAAAAESFKFIPALRDGRPTETILRMEQEFRVSGLNGLVSGEDWDLFQTEQKHPERVIAEALLDSPLKPLVRNAPVFPTTAENRESGQATIELLVDTEGIARLPRIVDATETCFGYAAVQAATGWRFEPPKAGGKPVIARARVEFRFGPRQGTN